MQLSTCLMVDPGLESTFFECLSKIRPCFVMHTKNAHNHSGKSVTMVRMSLMKHADVAVNACKSDKTSLMSCLLHIPKGTITVSCKKIGTKREIAFVLKMSCVDSATLLSTCEFFWHNKIPSHLWQLNTSVAIELYLVANQHIHSSQKKQNHHINSTRYIYTTG